MISLDPIKETSEDRKEKNSERFFIWTQLWRSIEILMTVDVSSTFKRGSIGESRGKEGAKICRS